MQQLTAQQCGESIGIWMLMNGADRRRVDELAQAAGADLAPWFGAAKRRALAASEVAILHGAMVMAVMANRMRPRVLVVVSDAYTACVSGFGFAKLQAEDACFRERFAQRMPQYLTSPPVPPSGPREAMAWAGIFVRSLVREPLKTVEGVHRCANRIMAITRQLLDFVDNVDVTPIDALDALDRETAAWPADRARLAERALQAALSDDSEEANRLIAAVSDAEMEAVESALAFQREQDTPVKG